jgi:alkylhydroperoxidase family enzyme
VDPKFETKLEDLERRLLRQPGALSPAIRQAAAAGDDVPEAVAGYVEKVRQRAYLVTDRDVRQLLEAGYTQDQIFELTVATAYGAARERLDRGLDAMDGRSAPTATATDTSGR